MKSKNAKQSKHTPGPDFGLLSVGDAVMFRSKYGARKVMYISSTEAGSDGNLIALEDADARDCGFYSRQEIQRVPTPQADRIAELEAQVLRMRNAANGSSLELIAAAPELLEACKAMKKANGADEWEIALDQADAAIAKAEGRN